MGKKIGIARITVSIDPEDVDLIDRLAALESKNRSAELRGLLRAVRPTLKATVEALEAAERAKGNFYQQAAEVALEDLTEVLPEVERIHSAYLGAISRLEGAAAQEPPGSNHGGYLDSPPPFTPPLFSLGGETPDDK